MPDLENAGARENAPAREDVKSSRKLLVLGVIVLGALAPAPVRAQDPAEVRAYLLSVKQLYGALEYESALAQIARARAITHTPAEETLLSLYEGAILADMNRKEESAAAFKKGLLLQPEAQLPVKVAPSVAKQFETIRENVKQELAALQKPPPPVVVLPPKNTDRPVKEPKVEPRQAAPIVLAPLEKPEASEDVSVRSQGFSRPRFLIPAITGGALMVIGGTSWALSRRELSRLNSGDPGLATPSEAQQASARGRTFQSVGLALVGAGAAGLGFSLGWYALGGHQGDLALSVGTQGSSAFVQGRWL